MKSRPNYAGWVSLVKVLLAVVCFVITFESPGQAGILAADGYKAEVFVSNLEIPKGLTINSKDELFVIESGKYRILKITPDGIVSVFDENGPGAPLDFHSWYIPTYPTKMAFDAKGDLYAAAVGGYYNPYNPYGDVLDTLFRITPDGTVQSVARQRFSPNFFFDIAALAFGPDGSLYMGETWSPHDILKVDLATKTSTRFAATISNPVDFLFDKDGNLYACLIAGYSGKMNIYKFSPDGTRTLFTDKLASPIAIAWGPEGDLYALDAATKSIAAIDPETKDVTTVASGFYYATDMRLDSKGNLFVAEPCLGSLSSRIYPKPACYGQIVKISKANEAPTAQAGPDQTVEMSSCAGASVTLDGSGSLDPDGDILTYSWTWQGGNASGVNPIVMLPLGTTTVTLTVDDGNGGTADDSVNVHVVDTTPAAVSVAVNPNVLWPPNHKYVNLLPLVTVQDACVEATKVKLESVTSNEPDNALGDGDRENDIVINIDGMISLRAERSGKGSGRVYTITYKATDAGENISAGVTTVTVPQSLQK